MDGTGSPGAASDEPEARQQKPAGAWAGYLIFALCLMVLIVLDARAAYDHSWAQFTGITAVILAFAIVCVGVVVLRRTAPQARRPFRTPWVPAVPALGFVCCAILMAFLPWPTWRQLFVWLAIGLLIYYGYGRHHSKLRR